MLELCEIIILAKQINESLLNKEIVDVIANYTPHKFAWYYDDPQEYSKILIGDKFIKAEAIGNLVYIETNKSHLYFGEGIQLLMTDKIPTKHQLLIKFSDNTYLAAIVKLWGGMWLKLKTDENSFGEWIEFSINNGKESYSPVSKNFSLSYMKDILFKMEKGSLKQAVATKGQYAGIGNGTCNEILYNAKIHPKRKVNTLSENELLALHNSFIYTIDSIIKHNGRDTETDLYGNKGNYVTLNTKYKNQVSCSCSSNIIKESYMGGSIYTCPICQKYDK